MSKATKPTVKKAAVLTDKKKTEIVEANTPKILQHLEHVPAAVIEKKNYVGEGNIIEHYDTVNNLVLVYMENGKCYFEYRNTIHPHKSVKKEIASSVDGAKLVGEYVMKGLSD